MKYYGDLKNIERTCGRLPSAIKALVMCDCFKPLIKACWLERQRTVASVEVWWRGFRTPASPFFSPWGIWWSQL